MRIFCLFFLGLFFLTGPARGQLIFKDDFNSGSCSSINTQGWSTFENQGFNPINGCNTGLTYAGYSTSTGGSDYSAYIYQGSGGEGVDHVAAASMGNVYFGFLISVQNTTGTTGLVMNLNTNGAANFQNSGFTMNNTRFGLSNNGSFSQGPTFNYGQTYLVVLKLNGSTGAYSLWVNPTLGAEPSADLSVSITGTKPTLSYGLRIFQRGAASAYLDAIRVGSTWSDIVGGGAGGLLLSESFSTCCGLTSNNWISYNGCCISTSNQNLNYPGYNSTGTNYAAQLNGNSAAMYKGFTSVTSGTVYAAFMVNVQNFNNNPNSGAFNFYSASAGNSFNSQQGFVTDSGPNKFGIRQNSGSIQYASLFPSMNTTYLVVLGYDLGLDQYLLWVNPNLGLSIPPSADAIFPSGIGVTSLDGISMSDDCCGQNLFLGDIRVSTNWADVTSPITTQPTNLFLNASSSNISGNFTMASSNPTGYIVLRSTGLPPNTLPADGVFYSNGQSLGNATVVTTSGSNNFSDGSLSSGTTYYYNIYSYNYLTSYDYYTTSPLQGIAATDVSSTPTSLIFSNVQDLQMDVSFTAAVPAPAGYVALRSTCCNNSPQDGIDYSVGSTYGSSTVVLSGAGTSFTDTGLSALTNYTYDVYPYSGVPGHYNYYFNSLNGNRTTLAVQPTAQPTGISFTGRTNSATTVNFTAAAGSPNGYLVLYRSGSAPTGTPVDGTTYTVGNPIGTGTVGYVGSSTAPVISGLATGLNYFYAIYSYNGSGTSINYYLTSPLQGSAYTLAAEPTAQPTSPVISSVTSTGFNVAFTAASPAPTGGYIALRKSGSVVSDSPVDGTTYVAGNTIGTSTVAYIGTSLNFTETTLAANTTYYYRIFSYGGTIPSTENYFTGGTPLTPNQTTLVTTPTATPATPITQTSFTANWNAVTGATNYRLDVATSNTFGGTILGGYNDLSVAGTSQSVTSLTAGTNYYYRVRAVGAGGTTPNSNTITALTIPPNPVSSAATSVGTTSFTANWGAATSASTYLLDVANDAGFTSLVSGYNPITVGTTSQSVTGLTAGNTYYYRVRAMNASGTSGNSGTITVLLIPPQPTTSAATAITNGGFTANWVPTNGAATYRLDVDDDPAFGSMNVNDLTVAGTSSAVSSLNANTTYYFRVRAVNATGTSASSSNGSAKTATNAPNATAATGMTASSFNANWSSVSGATTYSIDVANDNLFTSLVTGYNNLDVGNVTTKAVTSNLLAGNTYYYRVRANNPSASPSSGTTTVLLIPPAPVATAASSPSVSDFIANWNAANGATSYKLDVSTDNFSTFFSTYNNATVTGLSQSVTGLTSGTTYQYRVRAVNATGTSGNSNVISIVALPPGPNLNNATGITSTSFSISWSTVGGSDYYGFEVSTDNFATTIPGYGSGFTTTSTSLTVSGLSQGVTYQCRARAHNTSGYSAYSNTVSVALLADVPVATTATSVGTAGFTANWNAAAGAGSYMLDLSTDNFSTIESGYPVSVIGTSKAVSGLTPGGTYQYRVRGVTGGGETGNSNSVTVLLLPAAPVATAATGITQAGFNVNWNAVNGATDYFVDVATNTPPTNFVTGFNNVQVTGATTLAVTGLSPGTAYYFQVRARNATGTSSNSNVVGTTTTTSSPTSLTAEQIASDGFLATWAPVTGAVGYKLDVSKDNFATFASGYDGLDVGSDTEWFVTGLLSSTLYRFRVRAYNAVNVESANSTYKSVRTSGGVVTTPQISAIDFSDKFAGNGNDKIKVTLSGGEGEKTLKFFHRPIQATDFLVEITKPVTQTSYEYAVQDAWLDKTGVEFYFRFEDEIGQSTESSRKFIYRQFTQEPIPALSAGGKLENYRIFSVPVKLDDNSISEVFKSVESQYGGYDKTKWRLVHYEGGRNVDYTEGLNKIDQGKGYWFNSIDNVTVKISGSVIPLDQGNPFKMALEAGWTEIGNPYPFDISWVDVLAFNGNPAGVGMLMVYDAAKVSFRPASGLHAWEGGFVKSDNATTINVPVTVKQSVNGRLGYPEIENRDLSGTAWALPFSLVIGKAYNELGGIGMHPDAKPGNDRFDQQSLPRFIKYLELNSYHDDYFLPRFTRDVVPAAASHNWDYVVESNFDENDATLRWDNKSLGENDAQLLLYDVDENILIDMKSNSEYKFQVKERHRLKFFFGADARNLLPDITGLGRPYPNPSSSGVTIPFVAGVNNPDVQIGVYDMMGRKVRTVANGKFSPGMHEALWDGNDEQGSRVAQGIYIYRLTGSNTPAQQGRIVMK